MIDVVLFSFCKGERLFIFLKENSIKSKKTTCASFVVSFPAFFIMHVIEVLSFKVLVCVCFFNAKSLVKILLLLCISSHCRSWCTEYG